MCTVRDSRSSDHLGKHILYTVLVTTPDHPHTYLGADQGCALYGIAGRLTILASTFCTRYRWPLLTFSYLPGGRPGVCTVWDSRSVRHLGKHILCRVLVTTPDHPHTYLWADQGCALYGIAGCLTILASTFCAWYWWPLLTILIPTWGQTRGVHCMGYQVVWPSWHTHFVQGIGDHSWPPSYLPVGRPGVCTVWDSRLSDHLGKHILCMVLVTTPDHPHNAFHQTGKILK